MKFTSPGLRRPLLFGRTEDAEVLNGALLTTQNVAERVSRLRSRNGRFPWLYQSLNLSRSCNQLATVRWRVEILYTSSRDRICLLTIIEVTAPRLQNPGRAWCRGISGCHSDKRTCSFVPW